MQHVKPYHLQFGQTSRNGYKRESWNSDVIFMKVQKHDPFRAQEVSKQPKFSEKEIYSHNWEVRRLKWKITLPPKHARVTEVYKIADNFIYVGHIKVKKDFYISSIRFLEMVTSVHHNGPSTHFWVVTSWKTPIMLGIVLNADCIAPVWQQRPHLIFSTASLLGVTGGQGQLPRVRLESRLKCSKKATHCCPQWEK